MESKQIMPVALTDEQVNEIVQSDSYQRWKREAQSSVDWRYWCFRTLYPNEGVTIPEKFKLYVYIYLERDSEYVKPMERAIEFVLWWLDSRYAAIDHEVAVLMLQYYAKTHSELLREIADGNFKDTKMYAPVMRLLAEENNGNCGELSDLLAKYGVDVSKYKRVFDVLALLIRDEYLKIDGITLIIVKPLTKAILAWLLACSSGDGTIKGDMCRYKGNLPGGLNNAFGFTKRSEGFEKTLQQERIPKSWDKFMVYLQADTETLNL